MKKVNASVFLFLLYNIRSNSIGVQLKYDLIMKSFLVDISYAYQWIYFISEIYGSSNMLHQIDWSITDSFLR